MSSTNRLVSFGVRLGLVFIVQSAGLSAVSVLALLGFVAYNSLRNKLKPPTPGTPQWHFIRTAVDYYLLSLFFSDLILSTGSMMTIKWIAEAVLSKDSFCTVQGVLKQVGNVGVALSASAIALHTFLVLVFKWRAPQTPLLPMAVLSVIWLFIILITVIPSQIHKDPAYYGPSTYWCWIDRHYRGEQLGLEYAVLWFAAVFNLVLYIPVFLCLRGNLHLDTEFKDEKDSKPRMRFTWVSNPKRNAWAQGRGNRREAMVIARQMLAFPLAYILLIAPMSIIRWIQFSDPESSLPSEWTAFAGVFFSASGFVNVLLYLITRWRSISRVLLSRNGGKGQAGDVEVATQAVGATVPEVTTMSYAPTTQHTYTGPSTVGHGTSALRSPIIEEPPMLNDDDDDDDDFMSPASPTSHSHGVLSVPIAEKRNSWTSETSKNSYGPPSPNLAAGNDLGYKV